MRNYKAPLFQHRHYAAIAKVMAGTNGHDWGTINEELISLFRSDNPNFSPGRYMDAARGNPTRKDAR